uniref:DNA-directed RNA polymerase n=1 Tax=Trypanosoma congolense (strain IL3000) TaxID=1068625 RepID=G0USA2_TRYCI|nr:putative DNA-directed rna polymerase I largest subunit [Trypanosoma congolense IL3000]
MSLITDFPFHAYTGDLKTRRTMTSKDAVSLSLLTPMEIDRVAFVEVRVRVGQEDRSAPWRPVMRNGESHATFFDTRMGNFDVRAFPPQACQTCALNSAGKAVNERCYGHFGYIGMPRLFIADEQQTAGRLLFMNPHMLKETETLLSAKCFFCHRFRAPAFDVERYRQALILVDNGFIGEALHLLDVVSTAKGRDALCKLQRQAGEYALNDVSTLQMYVRHIVNRCESNKEGVSAQQNVVRKGVVDVRSDIFKMAMRDLRNCGGSCSHCEAISPHWKTRSGHFFFTFTRRSTEANILLGFLTREKVRQWESENRLHHRKNTYMDNMEIHNHLSNLFREEEDFLELLFPTLGAPSVFTNRSDALPPAERYKVFFIDRVLVAPLPLRLSSGLRVTDYGTIIPDRQTRLLSEMLGFVEQIECYFTLCANSTSGCSLVTTEQTITNELNVRNLQQKINEYYTEILDSFAKKEGLFRMNMMGKRVNQACRSVISPDPLVEPNEVVMPRPLAKALSYPEQVTYYAPARMDLLRLCVVNGPRKYPGATHLEIRHANGDIRFVDLDLPEHTRRQHAMKYFAMAQSSVTLIVHRHVLNGDRVIFNRQPTLHKPSMMGFRAKVLSGHKTIRFHYVNGSSFNADFDGDEMNIHVPQSLEAAAEVDYLMDANSNYLVPTSGRPIRGLIQDHVAAGVLLTVPDKFFDRISFTQLVFNGLGPYIQGPNSVGLSELIPPPAILKPRPLWTGKQLISVIVQFVSGLYDGDQSDKHDGGVSLKGTSLIQAGAFSYPDLETEKVITFSDKALPDCSVHFKNSELLVGLLCKKQLGASYMSISHLVHELYGPHKVGQLFGALGRVLLLTLRKEGLSLGMDDMCVAHEDLRCRMLRELDRSVLNLEDDEAVAVPKIMEHATRIQREFMPGRMLVPFPTNHLLLMTTSGAKGSNANAVQMSLVLGQQLFDGMRVKRMNSAKTLPAFFFNEKRARSFGFAMGSFATGIRPSEYTIHSMAGRDGLIDTAVKTSRSGHLQRCLIKGLESLVVHWDHTVRDSNGSVVQFMYGGDGLDPCKACTLTAWDMLKENVADLYKRFGQGILEAGAQATNKQTTREKRMREDESENGSTQVGNAGLNYAEQQKKINALPRAHREGIQNYLRNQADFVLFNKVSQVNRWILKDKLFNKLSAKREEHITCYTDALENLTAHRRMRAFCDPGESVGLLAAQAAGEPSTQMTLNTFHTAGSTVTHVTEGIPRLRELLIFSSVQKAAVIVPVVKTEARDNKLITRIIRAGVAIKLADCLARCVSDGPGNSGAKGSRKWSANTGVGKGYHYHVARDADIMVTTIAFLFSRSCLEDKRRRMRMAPSEHLRSLKDALREFGMRFVRVLRSSMQKENDLSNGWASEEAANLNDGFEGGDDSDYSDNEGNFLDDQSKDDNESSNGEDSSSNASSMGSSGSSVESHRGTNEGSSQHSEEDSSSDGSASVVGNDKDRFLEDDDCGEHNGAHHKRVVSHRVSRKRKGNAEEGDIDNECRDNLEDLAATGTAGYDTFPEVHFSLSGSRARINIAPLSSEAASLGGVTQLPDDFFIINVVISTPHNTVAVIPEIVDNILEELTLPSWLPRFDSVIYTQDSTNSTNGELVFQGESATMRNVMSFLSLFTVGRKSIQLDRAFSTDVRDMGNYFGIESAYKALYQELQKLFRRYSVDRRHLMLISDAATHRGRWENYNFTGVVSQSASPLFQMTFASSARWLHMAVSRGMPDDLQSLSSAIMVGERPRVGTAFVRVIANNEVLRDVLERDFD